MILNNKAVRHNGLREKWPDITVSSYEDKVILFTLMCITSGSVA